MIPITNLGAGKPINAETNTGTMGLDLPEPDQIVEQLCVQKYSRCASK
jgi:hypothetical protein